MWGREKNEFTRQQEKKVRVITSGISILYKMRVYNFFRVCVDEETVKFSSFFKVEVYRVFKISSYV